MNTIDEIGKMKAAENDVLEVWTDHEKRTPWVIMDISNVDKPGQEQMISIHANQIPKLIQLLQRAYQRHCSKESHTPQE